MLHNSLHPFNYNYAFKVVTEEEQSPVDMWGLGSSFIFFISEET